MSARVYLVAWSTIGGPTDLYSAEVFQDRAQAEDRARAIWDASLEDDSPAPAAPQAPPAPQASASGGIMILEEEVVVARYDDPILTDYPGRRERRGQAPGSPVLSLSDPESEDEGACLEVWEFPLQG